MMTMSGEDAAFIFLRVLELLAVCVYDCLYKLLYTAVYVQVCSLHVQYSYTCTNQFTAEHENVHVDKQMQQSVCENSSANGPASSGSSSRTSRIRLAPIFLRVWWSQDQLTATMFMLSHLDNCPIIIVRLINVRLAGKTLQCDNNAVAHGL